MTTSDLAASDPSDAAREQVIDVLKERIISGELRPGDRLRERTVSREFNVSRVPVREAFFILRNQGLIRTEPRRGAFVTAMTATDIEELFEVRTALEPLVSRLAALHRDDDDLTVLRADLDAAREAGAAHDFVAGSLANAAFHQDLLRATHNELLNAVMSPLDLKIQRLFRRTIAGHEHELFAVHAEMFEVVLAGDADRASALSARHVDATRARSLAVADDAD